MTFSFDVFDTCLCKKSWLFLLSQSTNLGDNPQKTYSTQEKKSQNYIFLQRSLLRQMPHIFL